MDSQTVIICYYDGNNNKIAVHRNMTDEQMKFLVEEAPKEGNDITYIIRVPNKTPIHALTFDDPSEWVYYDGI